MTLTAFLHGYPPGWSMGGEVSTHRTLRAVPGTYVFTSCDGEYDLDGVTVLPSAGAGVPEIMEDALVADTTVLFAHSTLSAATVQAARRLKIPSILAVHAPPIYAADLRRAWGRATVRLYNTNAARDAWNDPKGWVLHPPVGEPSQPPNIGGPHDALTLTSSLLNKGASRVLALAHRWPHRRFIIVRSPAHATHGAADFEETADALPNVEVWDRLHPNDMRRLWAQTAVLLVPSSYETYGLVALEAAWHGIPSVHVDTPHVREGIGDAARLLKTKTVDELEAAITEIEADYTARMERAFYRVQGLADRELRELTAFAAGVAGLTTT